MGSSASFFFSQMIWTTWERGGRGTLMSQTFFPPMKDKNMLMLKTLLSDQSVYVVYKKYQTRHLVRVRTHLKGKIQKRTNHHKV